MLAAAALAVQVIVLGASVFAPAAAEKPPRLASPLVLPQLTARSQAAASISGDTSKLLGDDRGNAAKHNERGGGVNQNLLQMLLPSDVADRKVGHA